LAFFNPEIPGLEKKSGIAIPTCVAMKFVDDDDEFAEREAVAVPVWTIHNYHPRCIVDSLTT